MTFAGTTNRYVCAFDLSAISLADPGGAAGMPPPPQ